MPVARIGRAPDIPCSMGSSKGVTLARMWIHSIGTLTAWLYKMLQSREEQECAFG